MKRQITPFHRILLAGPLLLVACNADQVTVKRADIAEVIRGPLRISVTESASIEAAQQTRVKCEMEGKPTIIWLIPEGSIVEKGQKIVELDSAALIDRRATQEIAVERSNASLVNARENLDILREEVASKNRGAQNTVEFAEMDKKKFYGEILSSGKKEMGEREQSIKAEEARIDLAKSSLKLAEDRYKWSVKLRAEEFITQDDLEKDQLDLQSKKTELQLAENTLAILKKYTHEKTKRELDQALTDARLELDRTRASGKAQIAQAEADFSSKEAENTLEKDQLSNLITQIKNAVVLAPNSGIVVYGSEGDSRRRTYVEEGMSVRERQTLIVLPAVDHMQAEMSIQEARIEEIKVGQKAILTVDTLPYPLEGRVIRRAPLPDSASRWGNPDLKVYKTRVDIFSDNKDRRIRPNMSATVEIIVAELKDVTYIPIAATRHQEAVSYVWLSTPNGPEPRKVELGQHNNTHIVVTTGLQAGDKVYLADPAGVINPVYEQPKADTSQQNSDADTKRFEARMQGRSGSSAVDASGSGDGGSTRSSSAGSFMQKLTAFKAMVQAKDAELGAKLTGFTWFRDSAIQAEFEADPEIKAEWDKLSTIMAEARKQRDSSSRDGSSRRRGDSSGRRGSSSSSSGGSRRRGGNQ
ncbi:MAG: HlyD family efflux transporter periplasmic adaptor subunit [Planctomycetota bacterium]|nr:HlyD family efflux transporter periplasmic adaptor subunit [Planctomycetota bacterium]